jgi:aspartyl-tRNA synthetase
MTSAFATSMRTHGCGELDASSAGETVRICGWVAHRRDHGGVTFIDLRDREGLVQVVFHPEDAPEAHAAAQALGAEDVVTVGGTVRERPEGMRNPALSTGEIEVAATSLELLNASSTPPFPVEDRVEASEELRLRYRYLDLRRPEMAAALALRHKVVMIMRSYLEERGFVEVETPMLTRSTPEGSRDFLVPSRKEPGSFYALPQSPQQLKQLLMIGGQDRYYQIVRCLRDEETRADRGFEFTQLDIEMSFVQEEDLISLIEPLYARILEETTGVKVEMPFERITYTEMIERFGSDKPDTRYGMELVDLSSTLGASGIRVFRSALDSGGTVKAIGVPGGSSLSRKELDQLVADTKGRGAGGLIWMTESDGQRRSPIAQHLSEDEWETIFKAIGAEPGDLVLIVADRPDRVAVALDGLRRQMAGRFGLIPEGVWKYIWMTEPPLFEWSEDEDKWVSVHHPFTAPLGDDLRTDTARARAYDLVLNGFEVGGGSIRIHQPEVQRQVFRVLGLSDEQIEEQFGHLIAALRFGAPPHGGIAMGLDRLVMLLAGKESLRDVTAFPKSQSGADPLTGAPAPATDEQLAELSLRVITRNEPAGREKGA